MYWSYSKLLLSRDGGLITHSISCKELKWLNSSLAEVVGKPLGSVNWEDALCTVEIYFFLNELENYCHALRSLEMEEMLFVLAWCVSSDAASVFDGKIYLWKLVVLFLFLLISVFVKFFYLPDHYCKNLYK